MNAIENKFVEEVAAKMEALELLVESVVEEAINRKELIDYLRVKEADEHLREGDEAYRQVILQSLMVQAVKRMARGLELDKHDPQIEKKLAAVFMEMMSEIAALANLARTMKGFK